MSKLSNVISTHNNQTAKDIVAVKEDAHILKDKNVSSIHFENCMFKNVFFRRTFISNVSFTECHNIDLMDTCTLVNVDFYSTSIPSIIESNLIKVNFYNTPESNKLNFVGCNLESVDLHRLNVEQLYFVCSTLSDVDFRKIIGFPVLGCDGVIVKSAMIKEEQLEWIVKGFKLKVNLKGSKEEITKSMLDAGFMVEWKEEEMTCNKK